MLLQIILPSILSKLLSLVPFFMATLILPVEEVLRGRVQHPMQQLWGQVEEFVVLFSDYEYVHLISSRYSKLASGYQPQRNLIL